MLLLVGLGNPGPKYEKTRHNIGFMALDEIARSQNLSAWRGRFQSAAAEGFVGTEKVLALKPQTYMNLSGQAVGEAMRYFKLPVSQVVVLYDDLDLALGKVKAKQGGGHAGHNGIKSMIQHCGADFWRIRMGIGHPGDKAQVTNYVLSEFAKAETAVVDDVCRAVGDEIPRLVQGDAEGFMSRVAQKAPPPKAPQGPKDTTRAS
ncbi:aminoacyl-tRNA hydrolase [Rhodovibrio sodomensis]|uniref:Peptidyl-tRNA hydrolase n=1 Tax=Rhodovibrio sodomensis TaxID=1088 RepID=A0ABS1DG17_9PROT|nr:aminoacyl-tRNA hydrolase [Rhodovibrio sodomensis]